MSQEKIEDILEAPGLSYSERVVDFFLLYLVAKNVDEVSMKVRVKVVVFVVVVAVVKVVLVVFLLSLVAKNVDEVINNCIDEGERQKLN